MTTGAANDFFQNDLSERKAEARTKPAVPALQFLRNPCECGAGGGWRMVGHYDVVSCNCGKKFWALQPKRNGPFVAYPWTSPEQLLNREGRR